MAQLTFTYYLKIDLDSKVTNHCFTLRCRPQTDDRQRIRITAETVGPASTLSESTDAWGNVLLFGSCRTPHDFFEIKVEGQAEVGLSDRVKEANPLRAGVFKYHTDLTRPDGKLRAFAASLDGASAAQTGGNGAVSERTDAPGTSQPGANRGTALAVMHAVHEALAYTTGSTHIRTTAAQAFAQGQGVCQDYAHVMLAVLREKGIPARYVAGMVPGEGETHAWVEVLDDGYWYGFDPTADRTVTDKHIKLSHGRDAGDCAINRGVFRGFAGQRQTVSVIVRGGNYD